MRVCAGHTLYKDKNGALSASSPSGEEIPVPTCNKFRVVAQKNLRTVNRELEMLMRQHIADYEDKHGEIVLPQNQD